MYRAILLPASWFPDNFLGYLDFFIHYLGLQSLPTFELKPTCFIKPHVWSGSDSVSHLLLILGHSVITEAARGRRRFKVHLFLNDFMS